MLPCSIYNRHIFWFNWGCHKKPRFTTRFHLNWHGKHHWHFVWSHTSQNPNESGTSSIKSNISQLFGSAEKIRVNLFVVPAPTISHGGANTIFKACNSLLLLPEIRSTRKLSSICVHQYQLGLKNEQWTITFPAPRTEWVIQALSFSSNFYCWNHRCGLFLCPCVILHGNIGSVWWFFRKMSTCGLSDVNSVTCSIKVFEIWWGIMDVHSIFGFDILHKR